MYSDESSETFPLMLPASTPFRTPCLAKVCADPADRCGEVQDLGGFVFNNLKKKRFCLFFQILADRSTKPK